MGRYSKMRRHKKYMKQKFATMLDYFNPGKRTWNDLLLIGRDWDYWKIYDMSTQKSFAKRSTNKKLRAEEREIAHNIRTGVDIDDIMRAGKGAEYRKVYDYDWEIW